MFDFSSYIDFRKIFNQNFEIFLGGTPIFASKNEHSGTAFGLFFILKSIFYLRMVNWAQCEKKLPRYEGFMFGKKHFKSFEKNLSSHKKCHKSVIFFNFFRFNCSTWSLITPLVLMHWDLYMGLCLYMGYHYIWAILCLYMGYIMFIYGLSYVYIWTI